MDHSPSGSFVHGILQNLERIAISFSRESSQPRDRTLVSFIAGGILYPLNQEAFARVVLKCVCTDEVHTYTRVEEQQRGPEDKYH